MQEEITEDLENFAIRLRSLIQRRRLKLREIAEACGVATSTVGAWTQGKNWPKTSVQDKLARFLGVSVSFLIHGKPEPGNAGLNLETFPPIMETGDGAGATHDETQAVYGSASTLRAEIRRYLERLLAVVGDDATRLGWVLTQLQIHLRPPEHWTVPNTAPPDAERSEAACQAALEQAKISHLRAGREAAARKQQQAEPAEDPQTEAGSA